MRISKFLFCVGLLLLVILPMPAHAQEVEGLILKADDLRDGRSVELHKSPWKYRSGDDPAWAARDFDDRDWKSVTNDAINFDPTTLEKWNGQAWFRLPVTVDENLVNQPLAMRVWNWGAVEIYLDGKLVERYGSIGTDGDEEEEFNARGLFTPVVFVGGGTHVIAVRHSFRAMGDLNDWRARLLARDDYAPGFRMALEPAQGAAMRMSNRIRSNFFEYLFIGLFVALAAVHLLLFVFYPAERGNLYYTLFVGGLALTIFCNRLYNIGNVGAETHFLINAVRNFGQSFAMVALLAFLYIEFVGRVSRFFWAIIVLWAVALVLTITNVSLPFPYFLMMLGVTFADCLRIIAQSLVHHRPGAWNIAAGVALLIFGVANNVAFERKIHFLPAWLQEYNLYGALLSVPLAVSIYLARRFARINRHLAAQLAKAVEHEKEKARLLVVEAENERRAEELEEARQLQLSMLPKKLPELPNLEIAAYMKPATEVGGDYYDFHVGKDGTLTVAVGDATGHGLKAGTVVTATKSLFNSFAHAPDISDTLKQISRSLKAMNLRGLFMALTILKIKDNRVRIGSAGMPAALIYRHAAQTIEEISHKALPLGSVARLSYREQEIALAEGDRIVLMSDGFPEMFNEQNELFGYDQAGKIILENSHLAPTELIESFLDAAKRWAGNRLPDDDVTFVVLQFKQRKDF